MSEFQAPNKIRRKPVPRPADSTPKPPALDTISAESSSSLPQTSEPFFVQSPSSVTTYADSTYDSSARDHSLREASNDLAKLSLTTRTTSSPLPSVKDGTEVRPAPVPLQPLNDSDANASPATPKSSKTIPLVAGQKIRSAYGEVRHFAGGLVTHPHESTKHYSILRHSHGLVYYSGSYTNLAITVFADRELPPDRSFWLQRKGWSGKTGLRAGVLLGTHGSWIDVTPSVTATADQMKPSDERAWQRDIQKFLRKAPKKLANHQVRETNVLRIPCDAYDGYLRVVMCAGEKGKKSLCPSPVFRLASTSMSSSSIRGASLRTLPIEAALKIGTFAAQTTANTFAGPYVETARTLVSNQITSVYQPSAVVQTALTTAYDQSGVPDRIDNMNEQYETARENAHQAPDHSSDDVLTQPTVIGDESGPQHPYPIRFDGKVTRGSGQSMSSIGIPTANLTNVDSEILLRHSGVHFGWASISLPKKMQEESLADDDWHEAIISIIPDPNPNRPASVVQKKTVRVYVIEDFDGATFFDAKVSVIMMGFLRPTSQLQVGPDNDHASPQPQPNPETTQIYNDILTTQSSLAREAWSADQTLSLISSTRSNRSLTEKYVDARQSTQKTIDRVPTWRVGVRSDGAELRDRFVGTGGVRILR